MKRKAVLFVTLLALCFSLTACQDKVPRGAAALLGYDLEGKNHKVTLSVITAKADNSEAEITLLSATGSTPEKALQTLEGRYGKRYIWGGLQCILLGEEAALNNSIGILEAIEKKGEVAPKIPVAVVPGRADTLMEGNEKPLDPGLVVTALENGIQNQITVESTLFSAVKGHREPLKNALVAVIKTSDDGSLYTEGCGIINDGKLIAVLDSRITAAINWLRASDGSYPIDIVSDKIGQFSGLLKNAKTTIKPIKTEKGLGFFVEVRLDAQVDVADDADVPAMLSILEAELEDELEQAVTEALYITVEDFEGDFFGLSKRYQQWCSFNGEEFGSVPLKELPFAINVKVSIGSWR